MIRLHEDQAIYSTSKRDEYDKVDGFYGRRLTKNTRISIKLGRTDSSLNEETKDGETVSNSNLREFKRKFEVSM